MICSNTLSRNHTGLTFATVFATQMFNTLGVNWAGSLLGFLALAFMPIPFLFYMFGPRLRKNSKYAPTEMGKKKNDEENPEGDGEKEKHEDKDVDRNDGELMGEEENDTLRERRSNSSISDR